LEGNRLSHNRATILHLFGITEEIHKRTLGSLMSQPRGEFWFSFTKTRLLKIEFATQTLSSVNIRLVFS